ncbi:MAG: hypothetical protein ABI400_15085 [Lacisediminihabitans sp.]
MAISHQPYQSASNAQPRFGRPPLTPRAKSGARWAGILGFNLMALGWFVVITPVLLSVFAAFLTFVFDQMGRSSAVGNENYLQLRRIVETVNVNAWVLPLMLVTFVGIVIWAVGIFVSGRILKSHAVNHPWGVTWAATGIAIVASWILDWVCAAAVQLVIVVTSAVDSSHWVGIAVGGALVCVVAIVIHSIIGWLAWWWMAHAMRSSRPAA